MNHFTRRFIDRTGGFTAADLDIIAHRMIPLTESSDSLCELTKESLLYAAGGYEQEYGDLGWGVIGSCYGYCLGNHVNEREPAPPTFAPPGWDGYRMDRVMRGILRQMRDAQVDDTINIFAGEVETYVVPDAPTLTPSQWIGVGTAIGIGVAISETERIAVEMTEAKEADSAARARRAWMRSRRQRREPVTISEAEIARHKAERDQREAASREAREAERVEANHRLGIAYAAVLSATTSEERRVALTALRQTALDIGDEDTAADAKRQLRELR